MRIPHIINQNTVVAYEIPDVYLRKEKIKPDDFDWDSQFIKKLRYLCLILIAENWETNPLFDEVKVLSDKLYLLEILSTDLPLRLTIPIINYDYFWERSYKARWPDSSQPSLIYKYDKPVNIFSNENSIESGSFSENSEVKFSRTTSQVMSLSIGFKSFGESVNTNVNFDEVGINDTSYQSFTIPPCATKVLITKSWKQIYLERHMMEELERMQPDLYNEEYITDLTDLVGEYVLTLNLKELQPRQKQSSTDHIGLHVLLANLENLIEFSVCYNKCNQGDNFSWHSLKMSENDAQLLGKGLEKSNLKILRVLRSDINCQKVKLLARSLCNHPTLVILDLSFCKIADDGARALAGMLENNKVIERLILEDNKIGPEGAKGLAFYMSGEHCKLVELNLKMNPIGCEGGKYISTALARAAKTLRSLNISSCGLSPENFAIGLMFALNSTLQKLDLSNNSLGQECVDNMLTGIEKNQSIIHLDVRMCALEDEVVEQLRVKVRENLELYRGILITPPSAQSIL